MSSSSRIDAIHCELQEDTGGLLTMSHQKLARLYASSSKEYWESVVGAKIHQSVQPKITSDLWTKFFGIF